MFKFRIECVEHSYEAVPNPKSVSQFATESIEGGWWEFDTEELLCSSPEANENCEFAITTVGDGLL